MRVLLALLLVVGLVGCGGGSSPPGGGTATGGGSSPPGGGTATTLSDPTDELRKIAERGKARAPTVAPDGWIFVDVHVHSIKTGSLTYPVVGRIMGDWKNDVADAYNYGVIERLAVYLKHDGTKWVFHKFGRGFSSLLTGKVGPNQDVGRPLTAADGLEPAADPRNHTISGAAANFTIWLPAAIK